MDLDAHALETSFDLVALRGEELMDKFYSGLFERAPSLTAFFASTDLQRQKAMLLGTLGLLRKSLRNLDPVLPRLQALGARHLAYGARPEHYPIVADALIAAMAAIAGPAWTAEHEAAWRRALAIVSEAMLEGANAARIDAAA